MRHHSRAIRGVIVRGAAFALLFSAAAFAQNPMTCLECHADPAAGGAHGGFRGLSNLNKDQIDVICISCHDGSYTNPGGVDASEAAVHQNDDPGGGRDEYGDFKASCQDCHEPHVYLNAGDMTANTNLKLLGVDVKEANSTDDVARIRKPIVNDNGTPSNMLDDVAGSLPGAGWECDSGIPDDPACIENDPPQAVDGVRVLAFYLDIDTAGTHWVSTTAPYIGACNTCHTRTDHHRRDDSGGDHTHNATRNCDDCHDHDKGWVNKGG